MPKHLQGAYPQAQQSGAGLPEIQQLQQGVQLPPAAPQQQQQQQGQTQVAATSLQEQEPAERTVATAIALLKTSMSETKAELTKVSDRLAAAADMVEGDDMDAGSADAEALCALLAQQSAVVWLLQGIEESGVVLIQRCTNRFMHVMHVMQVRLSKGSATSKHQSSDQQQDCEGVPRSNAHRS